LPSFTGFSTERACHSSCSVRCWLWQRYARGTMCSPTLSAAVHHPRRCLDCIQCPEIWSCDDTTSQTPLASDYGTDHLQAVMPRLPVSQRHSTCVPRRQDQLCNWHHDKVESAYQLINSGRSSDLFSTIGDHAFPVAAARAWNSLLSLVILSSSLSTFKCHPKMYLFATSY